MEADFWHQKWQDNEIGFHEDETNKLLAQYFEGLKLEKSSRVFLPLCGKTKDIAWLLSQGYRVVGAELSELAIQQLFNDLGVEPNIYETDNHRHYQTDSLDIFVGDIFELSRDLLGQVDAIYDRAALVALPTDMRNRYVKHLVNITSTAPQLLICFEYDQQKMDGPPFSINNEEVKRCYEGIYELSLLETRQVEGGLKGKCEAEETVWILKSNP